jgi:hypothetical protein
VTYLLVFRKVAELTLPYRYLAAITESIALKTRMIFHMIAIIGLLVTTNQLLANNILFAG